MFNNVYKNIIEKYFQDTDSKLAIAVLGAPASGKSYTVSKIKQLAKGNIDRLNSGLETDYDLTVDKLRSEFQSRQASDQIIGFYNTFNFVKELYKENPKEYRKWYDDIKNTWIKIDDISPSLTTAIHNDTLIINNASNEEAIKVAINQINKAELATIVASLHSYKDFKRAVRWVQSSKQQEAISKNKDIVYDETGDEPQKIIQRFERLRNLESPYITCAFFLHGKTPVSNLIQNAGRMVMGNDGGRDSSSAILQAWNDIENNLDVYNNTAEKNITITNTDSEITDTFNSLKQVNTIDNTKDKSIDYLITVRTQSPEQAYRNTINQISADPLAVKFFNAILLYFVYYLPGLSNESKQKILVLTNNVYKKSDLKHIFKEIVKTNRFNFKYNNLQTIYQQTLKEPTHNEQTKTTFSTFFKILEKKSTIRVFCDMDGVLADFHSGTREFTKSFTNNWKDLPVNFFSRLKKLPGSDKLLDFLFDNFEEVNILSAIPKQHRGEISLRAAEDKRRWLEKNFDHTFHNIIISYREEKSKYAKSKQDVLVDDLLGNIKEWEKSGGTGILYKNTSDAILQLSSLF